MLARFKWENLCHHFGRWTGARTSAHTHSTLQMSARGAYGATISFTAIIRLCDAKAHLFSQKTHFVIKFKSTCAHFSSFSFACTFPIHHRTASRTTSHSDLVGCHFFWWCWCWVPLLPFIVCWDFSVFCWLCRYFCFILFVTFGFFFLHFETKKCNTTIRWRVNTVSRWWETGGSSSGCMRGRGGGWLRKGR